MLRKKESAKEVAALVRELVTPILVLPFVLAAWCLGAELSLLGEFPATGVLSHWMIWAGIGTLGLMAAARMRPSEKQNRQGMDPAGSEYRWNRFNV